MTDAPEHFERAPLIDDKLIEWLEDAFPNTCIAPEETLVQAQRRAGSVDVINRLKAVQAWQNQESDNVFRQ